MAKANFPIRKWIDQSNGVRPIIGDTKMKRLLIGSLMTLLVLMASCRKEAKKFDYTWTGQEGIQHYVPACIIWYKQVPPPLDAWRPYEAFSQADANDMRNIILRLTSPEKKEPNPDIKSKDKLSLIFYNGFPEKLTVREVYFEIQNQTFIGPKGKSQELAQILIERKKINSDFYAPYKNLGAGHYHNSFHRILKSQESLRKQVERLKAEREADARERIEEPNQPK